MTVVSFGKLPYVFVISDSCQMQMSAILCFFLCSQCAEDQRHGQKGAEGSPDPAEGHEIKVQEGPWESGGTSRHYGVWQKQRARRWRVSTCSLIHAVAGISFGLQLHPADSRVRESGERKAETLKPCRASLAENQGLTPLNRHWTLQREACRLRGIMKHNLKVDSCESTEDDGFQQLHNQYDNQAVWLHDDT